MSVSLTKGQRVDLTKGRPSLKKILIGLGWDVNQYDGEADFDLDTSVFMTKENGKAGSDDDFIFYGNLEHRTKCVVHTGDNRTGDGDGDDEVIKVNFDAIPSDYTNLSVAVTIYDADNRLQNFGMVNNAYVRVADEETGEELIRYDLSEDFSTETAIVVAEIYKKNGEWKFKAVGSGYNGGLAALCRQYGIDAE
ncbi:TerD family protein [Faecalicatena contorta]|uniref:TerD family protein n=1 Tax=Faecalicatena contorta TaxID=39482 RepID=UPI00195FA4D7|nr:TerD family protein [Faecalicatena contorta]MBM6685477.1 TerD family protein [Faecalicatena contorta]MBM6710219.1 TerD family protein [Faecalicatena contorta]